MPDCPPGGSRLTQSQSFVDELVIASGQATIPSLRGLPRAYPKNSIVRSKQSHVTLARPRRRQREYPIESAHQGRSSTFRTSKTCDLPPRSSCHIQNEVDTAQMEKLSGSNGPNGAVHPTDSQFALGNNSCFLCLQHGTHQYAIMVRFAWPGKSISKAGRKKSTASTKKPIDISFEKEETQTQVMKAIQNAIYQQSGRWKRWLWCYEIRTAQEVNVSLVPSKI